MVLVFGWLTPVGLETETACARSLIFNGPGMPQTCSSADNNSFPADLGKVGKTFLFYANWCNVTGFLPLTNVDCKYMKIRQRRLRSRENVQHRTNQSLWPKPCCSV